jgi:hypothetical protein
MKDALLFAVAAATLYVALTWSYAGYKSKSETDSVADRFNENPRVNFVY